VLVVGTVALHVVVLLLPTIRIRADLPESSPPQDFPLVWRMAPGTAPLPADLLAGSHATEPAPPGTGAASAALWNRMEPVLEPSAELAANMPSPDIDALIPPPDAPPLALDPALPYPATAGTESAPPLVQRIKPVYPSAARSLRAEASVTVRLTIVPDGAVTDVEVLGCTRPNLGFEASALDAVRRWRYAPQTASALPRTVIVTVDFKRQGGK
jgi:TonB family protein